jgi:hypothetical protein
LSLFKFKKANQLTGRQAAFSLFRYLLINIAASAIKSVMALIILHARPNPI